MCVCMNSKDTSSIHHIIGVFQSILCTMSGIVYSKPHCWVFFFLIISWTMSGILNHRLPFSYIYDIEKNGVMRFILGKVVYIFNEMHHVGTHIVASLNWKRKICITEWKSIKVC